MKFWLCLCALLLSKIAVGQRAGDSLIAEFQSFWTIYRHAIIENDTAKLFQLTQFPFKVRGPLDYDPIIKYSKEVFPVVLKNILQQSSGLNEGETEAMRSALTEKVNPKHIQADWARVDELEFKRINGNWKCYFAFIEYETKEKIDAALKDK